jgi:hypothetical protein
MASSGGLPPPCSILTAPCSSETAVPHRDRRSRPCWRTCFCITRSTPGWPGGSPPSSSSATPTTRQDQGRVLQGRQPAWLLGAHVLRVPGVHVPGPRSPGSSGERVRRVPPGDQQGGLETAQPHRAQVAAAPTHRAEPRRARRDDQPGRPRMDAVLRRVLPLRVVHAPGAHQHLPWCAGPARSTDGYVPTGRPAQPGTASPCSSPATSPTGRGSGTP